MIASRTLDYGLVIDILKNEQLFDEISEDGVSTYLPDIINEYWVQIVSDQTIGLYRLHQLNGITFQIHAFILPEHRSQSKESGKVILEWCLNNLEFEKLVAEIPFKYQNVVEFTAQMGFIDEGINRKSFLKDGKIWDTLRMGITRSEVEQWLQH